MAIGNVIQRLLSEMGSYYSDDCDLSFFEIVFKDVTCETQQNEEKSQKTIGTDLFCKQEDNCAVPLDFNGVQKLNLTLSSFLPSGFYFALIQPPD